MTFRVVNPPGLGAPRGFNHGMLAPAGGRILFVAGQPAIDPDGEVRAAGFVDQFDVALARVMAVVREAGGGAEHVGRMTVYVLDMGEYERSRPALAGVWRRHMGTHYPAMALVEVAALVDAGAVLEIEATAVVP